METLVRVSAVVVIAAVITTLLKKDVPALGLLLSLAVSVIVLIPMVGKMDETVKTLDLLTEKAGIAPEYLKPVLQCFAVAVVTRLSGDFCRDVSQTALASIMEVAGTVAAVLLSMPLFLKVLETVLDVL